MRDDDTQIQNAQCWQFCHTHVCGACTAFMEQLLQARHLTMDRERQTISLSEKNVLQGESKDFDLKGSSLP